MSWHREIAKVTSTSLGYEGHGILSATLMCDFGGSGQGIGGFAFDEPMRDGAGKHLGRRGSAFGAEWIARCIRACGVETWEQIKGRTIFVVRESDRFGAKVLGIEPLPTEPGKPFIFDDLRLKFFPESAAS